MKKCLLTIIILIGFLTVSQSQINRDSFLNFKSNLTEYSEANQQIYEFIKSGKNDIIWSEEFDGGIPGDWQIVDNNDFCTFQHTYDGPQGQFSGGVLSLQSTTSDNGFVIIDSDLCNSIEKDDGFQPVDAYLQSPEINLTDYENVVLSFEHAFRYLYSNDDSPLQVLVSNDNENWVSFDVRSGVQSNHMSSNPVYQAINISEVAGGEESVWIRFHKSGTTHYYWMIDDVSISAFAQSDLTIETVKYGGYRNIPGGQQQQLNLSASVFNNGSINLNDVMVHVDINDRLFNESSNTVSVGAGEEKEIFFEETFLPVYKGEYKMMFSFSYNLFNDELGMYSYEETFWVTDSVYSRDDNSYTVALPADVGIPFKAGNRFDISNPAEATSLGVVLHHQSEPGAIIKGLIYEIIDDDFLKVVETSEYTVVELDIPEDYTSEPVNLVLPLEENLELEPGNSYLVAVEYIGVDEIAVVAGTSGVSQPEGASYIFYNDEWHEETITPLIRLYLGNNEAEGNVLLDFTTLDASCGDANGSAKIYPLTGTPPFSFKWSTTPAQTTQTAVSLAEGTYEVTVTDHLGYSATSQVEIIDMGGATPEVDYSINEPTGCGNSDGSIIIDPSAEYDYLWSTGYTGENLENISAGTYMVSITDQEDNCMLELLFYVNDSDVGQILADINHVSCFGGLDGSVAIEFDGDVEDPSYIWSTGETGNTIENLKADTYSVTATYNSCMKMKDFDVNEPDELLIEFEVTELFCYGENTGAIISEVTGGTIPYNYFWNTGSTNDSIYDLTAGNYSLTVTDNNNCKAFNSVNLSEPEAIVIMVDTIIEPTGNENNGAIKIIVAGGTGNEYIFEWNHGPTTQNVTGLPAGNYIVTVTDEAGCSESKSFQIGEVGVDSFPSQKVVSLFPNPAEDYVIIKYGDVMGEVVLYVHDIFGKLIYKEGQNVSEINETYRLNTETFVPGVYIIVVRTIEGDITRKLVVR